MQYSTTICPHAQHRWRAWAVNTQTSRQPGSQWFTVVVGTQTQLLHSTAEHCTITSSSGLPSTADELPRSLDTANQPLQSTGEHGALASSSQPLSAPRYPNVFGSPDSALSDALLWARTNARQPQVAAWLEACNQWDAAIAAGEHRHQKTTEVVQKPRHPMYEGGRYERKARCRDGVHPPRTH